ncbi:MAG: anthranilate synthase component [Clostridiales bacterium]|jgi:anthranilate synthase component 2|nr:anthranilate synthase component [Clostridiales bacterium]
MILLIDNYDSFSYNLFQAVGSVNPDIKVVRNDVVTLEEIEAMNPSAIVLSPGPGKPEDAGICIDTVRHFAGKIPILGVCLGHQAICEAYGGTVSYAKTIMHGKTSQVAIDPGSKLFKAMGDSLLAARYHSLAALRETLPNQLKVVAETADGEVMAVADEDKGVYGLQFHPESVLTPRGLEIIKNFLEG